MRWGHSRYSINLRVNLRNIPPKVLHAYSKVHTFAMYRSMKFYICMDRGTNVYNDDPDKHYGTFPRGSPDKSFNCSGDEPRPACESSRLVASSSLHEDERCPDSPQDSMLRMVGGGFYSRQKLEQRGVRRYNI